MRAKIKYIILNPGRKPRQQILQNFANAMAMSVEAIVAIIGVFVALPSTVMIIWTLVKRRHNAVLRRRARGMTGFFRIS